ncbi:MAG TPA: hypothetical protein VGI79_00030 [Caulobacteraceae bacterium]|jgi:carboxylesterase type B
MNAASVEMGGELADARALASQLASGPMAKGLIRKAVWASLDASWTKPLQARTHGSAHRRQNRRLPRRGVGFPAKRPAAFKGK